MVELSAGGRLCQSRPLAHVPEAMTDLIRRIAEERDAGAFGELFAAWAPRVKSFLMRQGADPATAEDLAQETMLAVWRKAALFSADKGTLAGWIYCIARNLRIDRVRREPVWQDLPQGHLETADEGSGPDAATEEAERGRRLKAALAGLPADQREAITLAYIDGLSQSEIAARLALPPGTVKSRLRLAYRKLRTAVEDLKQ
jgi:RNA polymerase sigma-70 factor (ECF subfamily)